MAEEVQASVEDRIADKIFGPEADDYDPDEEVQALPEDDEVEVEASDEEVEEEVEASPEIEYEEMEIDGELYEIPVKLKDYVLRQQDYTQKTQEVAQQRKEYEIRMGAIEQERKQYEFVGSVQDDLNKAYSLDNEVKQYQDYLRTNLDNLGQADILKIQMAVEEKKAEKDALTKALQTKYNEFQQAQEQSLKELLDKSTEVLRSKIPNWGQKAQADVREYALGLGFTEQEINSVYDPRYVEVLHKAAQYDKLQKTKAGAVKKVEGAPPIKPKSRNPMPEETKKYLNYRKKMGSAKSDKAKADLIRDRIADKLGL